MSEGKHIQSVLHHILLAYIHRENSTLFCPMETLNASSQNKQKSLCYLTFPHTPLSSLKKIIILSANTMQLHMDPSLPKEILYKGPQQIGKRQHSHHRISLKADHVCPILNGHSSCISLGDKSSLLFSSCQQDLKLQE